MTPLHASVCGVFRVYVSASTSRLYAKRMWCPEMALLGGGCFSNPPAFVMYVCRLDDIRCR